MAIKLLPNQIPTVWDNIKFATAKVEQMSEKDLPLYFQRLLISLLNERAQCFVRLDDARQLTGLFITRITKDDLTGERVLIISSLYSFKSVDIDIWQSDFEQIKTLARNTKCSKVIAYSTNERVFEIAKSLGFTERFRSFVLEV